MSINIALTIFDWQELVDALSEELNPHETKLLIEIMEECGHFLDYKYVLLNNEYGDEWSPYYNLSILIDSAFPHIFDGIKKSASKIITHTNYHGEKTIRGISHVDINETANKLGIKLTDS